MNTVQYGAWKIAVDIDKTKQYYNAYERNNNQANRNFAEYCKNLKAEEKDFFDAFGIDPVCCEIEHIGVDKKGHFPCGGYFLACANYLEVPPEELTTIEDLAANDFVDERPDPRVDIGLFQFDFQYEGHVLYIVPEDMPQGFICIRFWCEDMMWLLPEEPEMRMYEPPRFWEIGKRIKEATNNKKQHALDLEETKAEFLRRFDQLNISAVLLTPKETKLYKREWVTQFTPPKANKKKVKAVCLDSRRFTMFLWHMFSFEILKCETDQAAALCFERQNTSQCTLISNVDGLAFRLTHAEELTAEWLAQFVDVTVTAHDFSWTYTKTHEDMCGPYFYKK